MAIAALGARSLWFLDYVTYTTPVGQDGRNHYSVGTHHGGIAFSWYHFEFDSRDRAAFVTWSRQQFAPAGLVVGHRRVPPTARTSHGPYRFAYEST